MCLGVVMLKYGVAVSTYVLDGLEACRYKCSHLANCTVGVMQEIGFSLKYSEVYWIVLWG